LILRKGKQIIVVADYTKFNCESTSHVGPLSSIHKIVTDDKAPAGTVDAIRGMGIEVIIAT
jgi:DeoR family transcriptional regulator of aga operon/DeoR family fructose operon transcriptional repressor